MQPTKRRAAIVIYLLVRKRAGSKGHWWASASFMWSDMRQRAEISQKVPTPMRPDLSCRTVPSVLAASAENHRWQGNVQKPITRQVGAAASGVTTFLLAPNTLVLALATKAFVAPATSKWRHSVIVVKSKRASNAATKMKRRKVIHGLGRLTAAQSVGGCSIVESKNIGVRRGATHSQSVILTVPPLPTW
jgi:hypothetical protein